MSNSEKGKVIHVLELESGTSKAGKDWQKKDFVIETDDQYPKKVCFTCFGDKINLVPAMGEDVKVHYNLESREYEGRWFHNVNCWKVDRVGQSDQVNDQGPPPEEPLSISEEGGEDLPF